MAAKLSPGLTSVIVPAYNEEKNVASVIKDILKLKREYDIEIIVVDDGSKDKTAEVAKKAGADKIISYKKNRGKGAAFRAGIEAAKGEFIVQIDADHQFQPKEIPQFIEALRKGYDLVLGTRFKKGKIEEGSVSRLNLFGNWLMSITTTFFSGIEVSDIMAGFKGFKTKVARQLNLITPHFGYEAEVIVKAGKLGLSVYELPITYTKRLYGSSGISAIRDGTKVTYTIAKLYVTFPGPPPGKGVVGTKILKLLIPFWLIILLPIFSKIATNFSLTSPVFLIQFISSIILFFVVQALTGSRLAGLTSSAFLAITIPYGGERAFPSTLIFPNLNVFDTLPQFFLSATFSLAFVLFITTFLQDKRINFFRFSILSLTLLHLSVLLFSSPPKPLFSWLMSSSLIVVGIILMWYFAHFEKLISRTFAIASVLLLLALVFKTPPLGVLGVSLFVGTLMSCLFLEAVSFRVRKSPLFSVPRLLLAILLGSFGTAIFSLKFLMLYLRI